MPIQSKQIQWLVDSLIQLSGVSASGTSTNLTSAITTALSTAGSGGVSVPLQVASSTQVGVNTTGSNTIALFDTSTKKALRDTNGNEIYGKLTQTSGVYTLSYFSNVAGTETAYTLPSSTLDVWFSYRFDMARIPPDFAIRYNVTNVNESIPVVSTTVQKTFREALTITGAINSGSALPDLTKTPISAGQLAVYVNGIQYSSLSGHFTLSAKTITWTNTISITTTDQVVVVYETTE